jgi:hypothetical protein
MWGFFYLNHIFIIMGKIIKITESQLNTIVEKVINEQKLRDQELYHKASKVAREEIGDWSDQEIANLLGIDKDEFDSDRDRERAIDMMTNRMINDYSRTMLSRHR